MILRYKAEGATAEYPLGGWSRSAAFTAPAGEFRPSHRFSDFGRSGHMVDRTPTVAEFR